MAWKETENSIVIDAEVSFSIDAHTFEFENSHFLDTPHKHLRNGDLAIVEEITKSIS